MNISKNVSLFRYVLRNLWNSKNYKVWPKWPFLIKWALTLRQLDIIRNKKRDLATDGMESSVDRFIHLHCKYQSVSTKYQRISAFDDETKSQTLMDIGLYFSAEKIAIRRPVG